MVTGIYPFPPWSTKHVRHYRNSPMFLKKARGREVSNLLPKEDVQVVLPIWPPGSLQQWPADELLEPLHSSGELLMHRPARVVVKKVDESCLLGDTTTITWEAKHTIRPTGVPYEWHLVWRLLHRESCGSAASAWPSKETTLGVPKTQRVCFFITRLEVFVYHNMKQTET